MLRGEAVPTVLVDLGIHWRHPLHSNVGIGALMGAAMISWVVARVHVGWERPPARIGGTPSAGGWYTGGPDGVLICGVRHVGGHAPVWEVLQVWAMVHALRGSLVGVWLVCVWQGSEAVVVWV